MASDDAREILVRYIPGLAMATEAPMDIRLGQLVAFEQSLTLRKVEEAIWDELAAVADGPEYRPYAPAIEPDSVYEGDDVEHASAALTAPAEVVLWDVIEIRIAGPSHGNPFVDVDLQAEFICESSTLRVGGFYDGEGQYVIRALADTAGAWSFTTRATARSLDGLTGAFNVNAEAKPGAHGPVRVDGMHFRYADDTRYLPIGTTCYAWTHQPDALQEQTLASLESSAFNKIRMCVFPKSYKYNGNEPSDFPFVGNLAEGFDFTRFNPEHFRKLEHRIAQLAAIGVEADLILFHAYDRWGFADMGPAVDERYLRYVVRRLSAFANVWWSLANEYDLLWGKQTADWERIAEVIGEEDAFGHLTSIHNCFGFYDHSRPWVTHVSAQRVDWYKTAENTTEWREQWHKPVVIDECAYEGNIDMGWGNISGEEMTRRFWEGAVRGGYTAHGETYHREDEILWWSKGGELHGTSPARIKFLAEIMEASPVVWEPLPARMGVPSAGTTGEYVITYFGFQQPAFQNLALAPGEWTVDVIDTWNMTIDRIPSTHSGTVHVDMPGRPFCALRLQRVDA